MRYFFGAIASAVVLPAINKFGVGWLETISAVFLIVTAGFVYLTVLFGKGWRENIDARKAQKEAREASGS